MENPGRIFGLGRVATIVKPPEARPDYKRKPEGGETASDASSVLNRP
jgi:hypothetical protein